MFDYDTGRHRARIATPSELGACVIKPKHPTTALCGWRPKLLAAEIW
jgi:hypothetical protein